MFKTFQTHFLARRQNFSSFTWLRGRNLSPSPVIYNQTLCAVDSSRYKTNTGSWAFVSCPFLSSAQNTIQHMGLEYILTWKQANSTCDITYFHMHLTNFTINSHMISIYRRPWKSFQIPRILIACFHSKMSNRRNNKLKRVVMETHDVMIIPVCFDS